MAMPVIPATQAMEIRKITMCKKVQVSLFQPVKRKA
jgi:hypothetical protein